MALGHARGRVAAVQAGCWGLIIARGCKQDAPPCCHLSLVPQLLSCTPGCCRGPSPASGGTTVPQLSACGWLWGCFEHPMGSHRGVKPASSWWCPVWVGQGWVGKVGEVLGALWGAVQDEEQLPGGGSVQFCQEHHRREWCEGKEPAGDANIGARGGTEAQERKLQTLTSS